MCFSHPADEIVDIMNRLYYHGMTTASGGNLSIMDKKGYMRVSPSGVDRGSLVRKDIMQVKEIEVAFNLSSASIPIYK